MKILGHKFEGYAKYGLSDIIKNIIQNIASYLEGCHLFVRLAIVYPHIIIIIMAIREVIQNRAVLEQISRILDKSVSIPGILWS
jgi:hypothetical protein